MTSVVPVAAAVVVAAISEVAAAAAVPYGSFTLDFSAELQQICAERATTRKPATTDAADDISRPPFSAKSQGENENGFFGLIRIFFFKKKAPFMGRQRQRFNDAKRNPPPPNLRKVASRRQSIARASRFAPQHRV